MAAMADRKRSSGTAGLRQLHAERQHAVLVDAAGGVGDDGEVLVVELRLADERGPLLPRDRRQRPVAHRGSAVAEPLDHRVDVEIVSHRQFLAPLTFAPRRSSGGGSSAAGRAGRVFRQNQYVNNPMSRATTRRPVITRATIVPVLSLVPAFGAVVDDESVKPGTRSGPPFGAVPPGGTAVVIVGSLVDVGAVVVVVRREVVAVRASGAADAADPPCTTPSTPTAATAARVTTSLAAARGILLSNARLPGM